MLRPLLTTLVLEQLEDGKRNDAHDRYDLACGRVIAIGPGPYESSGILYTPDVGIGDVVFYLCGEPLWYLDEEFILVDIKNVMAAALAPKDWGHTGSAYEGD